MIDGLEFETEFVKQNAIGLIEEELAKESVPIKQFAFDPVLNVVYFTVDDAVATQQQLDWAQDLADNMQSLTVNLEDELGNPITEIPDDGITKLIVTCDELPTEFGYSIFRSFYNQPIVDDMVDTDGILEIASNEIGTLYVRVYDLADHSRVNYVKVDVVANGG